MKSLKIVFAALLFAVLTNQAQAQQTAQPDMEQTLVKLESILELAKTKYGVKIELKNSGSSTENILMDTANLANETAAALVTLESNLITKKDRQDSDMQSGFELDKMSEDLDQIFVNLKTASEMVAQEKAAKKN